MTGVVVTAGSAVTAAALVVWAQRSVGPRSPWFALAVVWLPMTAAGTISHVVPFRLPDWWHRLRPVEIDGRLHERLGVPLVKRLLRRGPATLFNPGLRLPAEPTPERIEALARRMCTAEAAHAVSALVTLGVAAHAGLRRWWWAVVWTVGLDLVVNGYPVLLQRYNRARLRRRFGPQA